MKRHFFMESRLDQLEKVQQDLLANGLNEPQIHVLSRDDAGVVRHHLHEVHSLLRQDVMHSARVGAMFGLAISALSITVAYASGLPETLGWVPFVCLSLVLLGFFVWEGGLFGIQVPNAQFQRFEEALQAGQHMLIVDIEPGQEAVLRQMLNSHPGLKPAGMGLAAPSWLVRGQQRWQDFVHWAP